MHLFQNAKHRQAKAKHNCNTCSCHHLHTTQNCSHLFLKMWPN